MSETLDMIAFGPFRLDTDRRQLTRRGALVALSSRAFDILVMLVENRGRVVTKDEIMTRVWRGMIVEENNLAVQISALRRALSDSVGETQLIMTVPGQGYRFVGKLDRQDRTEAAAPAPAPAGLPLAAEPGILPDIAMPPAPVPKPAMVADAVPAPQPLRFVALWRSPAIAAACAASLVALAAFVTLRPVPPPPAPAVIQPPPPPRLSIAVLPFRDLSDDRCCDYLADAISDDLTTDLSLIPGSVVIARESSDMFRGHPAPAGAIGRSLNVRYLLEGSLRAEEGAFSINAQLIEAASGAHLWAERFTVPRAHLADAQNDIVQRLASALGVKLVDIESARSAREHARNPDALDLYLRARSILDRSDTLEAMDQAQPLLEQALQKQPDDVKALSELGWLLPRKLHNFVTDHRAADLAEARDVTARAVLLEPQNASVLAAKAALQAFDGNCGDAQITFQAALESEPNSVRALTGLTICKFQLGRFSDALGSLAALLRIDPEGPRQKTRFYQMGFAELMLGHADRALPWLQRAMAGEAETGSGAANLSPSEWTRLCLIAATRLAGDAGTSDTMFAAYLKAWPNRSTWALEAHSPRSFSAAPGFRQLLDALQAAGMKRFADDAAGAANGDCATDISGLTPRAVKGLQVVDSAAMKDMAADGNTRVLDFGTGAAVPAFAHLATDDPSSADGMNRLLQGLAPGRAAIIVMGAGPGDVRGCQAASLLGGKGTKIYWHRGGEEAWAAAGLPFSDQR